MTSAGKRRPRPSRTLRPLPIPGRNSPNRKPAPIAVVWQATEPAPRGWTAWLRRLLAGYVAALGHPGAGVTLLVANDARLRDLNAAHRGVRRPTDILSFSDRQAPRRSGRAPRPDARREPDTRLGELAVSWDRVRAQAEDHGWDPRTEMARLLAHGCVHLMGHDHATRAQDAAMLRIEVRLLAAAGFAGLYPSPETRRGGSRAGSPETAKPGPSR